MSITPVLEGRKHNRRLAEVGTLFHGASVTDWIELCPEFILFWPSLTLLYQPFGERSLCLEGIRASIHNNLYKA